MHARSLALAALAILGAGLQAAQRPDADIIDKMSHLRQMPDDQRAVETKNLAYEIRALTDLKTRLDDAYGLANLATEGDFGVDTLQAVTDTLDQAVAQDTTDAKPPHYDELAQLAWFEGMHVDLTVQYYQAAKDRLKATEAARAKVNFTLADITGKSWRLSDLKGKVVLVNFWATWCPPCRKEMPDLEALQAQFKNQGLIVLAVSDEKAPVVKAFIAKNSYTFPILLDLDRAVNKAYDVEGIPKSFIYDRRGKLVAESIDMRTKGQFLSLLAKAGLQG